jgi:hypothetical protein
LTETGGRFAFFLGGGELTQLKWALCPYWLTCWID